MAAMAAILDFRSEQFQLFDLQVTLILPIPSFESFGLSVQEKFKTDFQDGHLGFPVGTILAFIDLQVTVQVILWPFGSGEEA